jgi:hypothetical protein
MFVLRKSSELLKQNKEKNSQTTGESIATTQTDFVSNLARKNKAGFGNGY